MSGPSFRFRRWERKSRPALGCTGVPLETVSSTVEPAAAFAPPAGPWLIAVAGRHLRIRLCGGLRDEADGLDGRIRLRRGLADDVGNGHRGVGPEQHKIPTTAPFAVFEPAVGLWPATMPLGTDGLTLRTALGTRPAALSAASASAWLLPTTLGTEIDCAPWPGDTTKVTLEPGAIDAPATGFCPVTMFFATVSLYA